MLDEKIKTTLSDWLEWANRFDGKSASIRERVIEAFTSDPVLLMDLLGIDENEVWNKFATRARERGEAMRTGTDHTSDVEMTALRVSEPVRPHKTFVSAYVKSKPAPKLPSIPLHIQDKTMRMVEGVIMEIDGLDIRRWTLGRVKTAAPRRKHEARVLERIAKDWRHLPQQDTVEVGSLYADNALRKIINECRAG